MADEEDKERADNFYHTQVRLQTKLQDNIQDAIEKRDGFRRTMTGLILLQVLMFALILAGGIAGGLGILPAGGVIAIEIAAPVVLIAAFSWMCWLYMEVHARQTYAKDVRVAQRELTLFHTDPKIYTEDWIKKHDMPENGGYSWRFAEVDRKIGELSRKIDRHTHVP